MHCRIDAKVAIAAEHSYQEDIGFHVGLHPVLDGICWHTDEC